MEKGTIDIKLERNLLTANPNDYRAVVTAVSVYTEEDLIDRIQESGAGPTRSDIAAVLTSLKQIIPRIIREGSLIKGDLFTMSFTAPGTYNPLSESEHPTIELHIHPGKELKEAAASLRTHRVSGTGNEPVIIGVMDVNSGAPDRISAGGVFLVKGNKIKVEGTHADAGLYFKAVSGGAETKFTGHFAENHPSQLMLQAPALPAGVYRLLIKTQYSTSRKELSVPRVIEYPNDITVT